ncbi:MAG: hypothetical protein V8R75_07005 [Oscillospiraceae bacterium]
MKKDTTIPPEHRRILKKRATLTHPPYSHFSKRKRRLEIAISKPPQGRNISFRRMETQPPKQRFFYYPVGRSTLNKKSD